MNPMDSGDNVMENLSTWTISSINLTTSVFFLPWYETGKVQIGLYGTIFLLAVIGNTLIILTLAQNRRMRTVTNLFLLNLAVADLLLGVLCMPFTLIGALLRDFVFGETMCRLIPFLQACSVSVGAWTLVAISVERYYAICHPLRSLVWQTISHAYKTIFAIWIGSFICMLPIAILSELKPTKQGNHKCRENWPSNDCEKAYNLFLDVMLMVLPLLVLIVTYSLITRSLWKGIQTERISKSNGGSTVDIYVNLQQQGNANSNYSCRSKNKNNHANQRQKKHITWSTARNLSDESNSPIGSNCSKRLTTGLLRKTNAERSLCNKKRVIKMLCVVVLEFFICWCPLYVINTIVLFNKDYIYENIGYAGVSFFQLLAYTSSCCNPITYCFMNRGFRNSFLKLFSCLKSPKPCKSQFRVEGSDCNIDLRYSNHLKPRDAEK